MRISLLSFCALACALGCALGCAGGPSAAPSAATPQTSAKVSPETPAQAPTVVVSQPDRRDADRALDPGRKPVALLEFMGVEPGMRVAEIAAGTGYTTELLARSVGPTGEVYAVNNQFVLERFAEGPWSERLKKPVMANVTRIDREFDDPLPPEVTDLDLVCNVLFYHDSVWMETDRAAMNAAVHRALRPGGLYVVIDHAAAPGRGVQDAKTLHRIEESVVRAEIEAAGFELIESGDFLENPDDPRDWNASPSAAGDRRGESDRFALKFRKR